MESGVAMRGLVTCYSQSHFYVCIPCFKSVATGFVLPKYQLFVFCCFFFVFFLGGGGSDMNTEVGVDICMYLKYSQDYIDSKYIQVHGLTP